MDVCPSAIHVCFIRATAVDAVGNPIEGPNNVYITDDPIMLTATPDVLAGEVKDQKGGCDQLLNTYRGQDIVKRQNLELDLGHLHPGLEYLLTGAPLITNDDGDAIGVQFEVPCGVQQPYTCIEAWEDLWDCDHQPSDPYPYRRHVFPSSRWVRGAETMQNDFNPPKFTGFTVGNPNWGLGIFGDQPQAVNPQGAWFYDTIIPDARCGLQDFPIT
jgi:hypothetical protein